jgi:predicted dehydrogenase
MNNTDTLRVGFIGAGAICRDRHLPGLAKIAGVDVVAVANRTQASGEAVAKQFNIADVMTDWRALLGRSDIDAVFIGTWPYMHKEMSIAALEAGKHVFCQARMCMNLDEAKLMVAAAKKHSKLVNMICPPPHRMPFEPYIKRVLAAGELGTITAIELFATGGSNLGDTMSWREDVALSGRQIMAMGICAETLHAWVGPYSSLIAQLSTPIATKKDSSGKTVAINIPQVVTITGKLASGAIVTEHHSGVVTDTTTPRNEIIIHGLKGTLRHKFLSGTIERAGKGEALQTVAVPPGEQRDWWAEQEFVEAVRAARTGKSWNVTPDFEEGLLYMRKVEAVHLSAASGQLVKPGEL